MRRRSLVLAVCSVLLLAMFAVTTQAAVVVKAVNTDAGYRFRPKVLEVGVGTKVTWKAVAGSHTVTATSKNWSKDSLLSIGSPTSFTFSTSGTFRYRCTIHSSIDGGRCTGHCGKVIVG